MSFSLARFRRHTPTSDDLTLEQVRADCACCVNENATLRAQLDLAVEVVDVLRVENDQLHAVARERERFIAQISRAIEASVPHPYDEGDV